VTRQVDELAAHVRRLGNHELNELLLQLPKPRFVALAEVALARPVLSAGVVLRFEPAPGVDGWTVVACAPRRRLGTLTRDRDPSGRLVYRAWTRAGDPIQNSGISSWRRRGDAAAALAWVTPVSGARCLALAALSAPFLILRCTSCWPGCPGIGSTGCWMPPTSLRGRRHDRRQAVPSLRPGQGGGGVLPAPAWPAAVRLLPALHRSRLPRGPRTPAPGPGHSGPAAGGGSGPPAPPPGPGPPGS
jgi:hypothetical protein